MVLRRYQGVLRSLLRRFPVVTVLGPRQCGKTTFIRQALPDWTYLDLERPSHAAPLAADPEARLAQLRGPVVLDEAQRAEDARGLLRCMSALRLPRGYLVYPGTESYALGRGVTALPAERLLAHPERLTRL